MRMFMLHCYFLLLTIILSIGLGCHNKEIESSRETIEKIKFDPNLDSNAKGKELAKFIKIGDTFDHVKDMLGAHHAIDGHGAWYFSAYYWDFNLMVWCDDKGRIHRVSQPKQILRGTNDKGRIYRIFQPRQILPSTNGVDSTNGVQGEGVQRDSRCIGVRCIGVCPRINT